MAHIGEELALRVVGALGAVARIAQLMLDGVPMGRVARYGEQVLLVVEFEKAGRKVDREYVAVLRPTPAFDAARTHFPIELPTLLPAFSIGLDRDVEYGHGQQLFAAIAELPAGRVVDSQKAPRRV